MRKTYEFVSTDMDELDRLLVAGYEQFFGKTVMPGSPERLFISWVEDAIMYERAQNNWTGCQNLPSSAEGEYLDGLAELFYLQERPKPTAATCTMRFYISEPRQTARLRVASQECEAHARRSVDPQLASLLNGSSARFASEKPPVVAAP